MVAPHRPDEITYYDELGIERGAAPEQVRDAFRGLARLLHPDSQTDEQLKLTAERQMRKLNRIYAVLSDADKRQAYDDSLDEDTRSGPVIVISPDSAAAVRKLAVRAVMGTCIAVALVVVSWVIWDIANGSNAEVSANVSGAGASGEGSNSDPVDTIASLRSRLRIAEQERNAAQTEVARLRRQIPGVGEAVQENPSTLTELPQADSAPARAGKNLLLGTWVYSRPLPSASRNTQYPPEYIEASLTEFNGQLRGQYRSRYQILDHAISPDVNFDFEGRTEGSKLNAAWRGSGGAKGHIELRLTAENQVEVTWNASELGSQQWVASGAAILSRKQ